MKVLFIATVVKNHIMEFHIPYLKMFKDAGWETAVAAKNDFDIPEDCIIPYCDYYYDIPFERSPLGKGNIKAYRQLKKMITENEYDIIHCHTPVGGAIGRIASSKSRKNGTVVFYTAHGFHFFKGAPIINWVVFYPIERFLARQTDVLITINNEDYKVAKQFKTDKVCYVPGVGVNLRKFEKGSKKRAKELRRELGIPDSSIVWLSVGEINKNKNHALIIEALKDFENTWFVLCGRGPLTEELKEKARRLGVSNRVIFAGYRTDLEDFYKMSDLFIFPSFREGLPVALMEAMASGLKCVASKNRGTDDLLPSSKLKFNPKKASELEERIKEAMMSSCSEEIQANLERLKQYDINNVLRITKDLYMTSIHFRKGDR